MIICNVIGGLANRMRAIASAHALARDCHAPLRVVWRCDDTLNAPFEALFDAAPARNLGIDIRSLAGPKAWQYMVAGKRNLYLPRVVQSMRYGLSVGDHRELMTTLMDDPQRWVQSVKAHRNVLIQSGLEFYPIDEGVYRELFVPAADIEARVLSRSAEYSPHTVGVHIRRTDNLVSIERSPDELFIGAMEREIEDHGDTKFYLATDSEDVKATMRARFGERILTANTKADRNSLTGMQEALTEMLLLSRTTKIYGSYWSSYSEAAARLTGIPLQQLALPKS